VIAAIAPGTLLLIAATTVTPEIRYFQYERRLAVQAGLPVQRSGGISAHQTSGSGMQQTCVVLDAELFAHAAPGLADVRLYRGAGTGTGADRGETPYVMREAGPPEDRRKMIPPLNLGHRGAHTTFAAAMPEGRYSDVELAITAKNFIATVAVTGAQTEKGREGTELGLYTIFDLTGQKLGRSTVLHLPESDFRYLYFSIDGTVKPGDVQGLSVERLPAKQQYVTVAETNQIMQKGKETVTTFKVAAHVPVERVEFVVGVEPANFSRDVTVQAGPVVTGKQVDSEMRDQALPGPVGTTGSLLRLHATRDGHKIDEEDLAVGGPYVDFGPMGSTWTVTVDNGDDVPLAITAVKLEMAERQLCFDAAAGAEYTLMYGDPALSAPRYDYATLFVAEADAARATLAAEQVNPEYEPRPDERPFTEKHPALLWVALVAVVVVLGVVAVKTAKEGKAA
jgi:hypothetical protein